MICSAVGVVNLTVRQAHEPFMMMVVNVHVLMRPHDSSSSFAYDQREAEDSSKPSWW
jgi:hypothetical protein